jgi:hypothetical protein
MSDSLQKLHQIILEAEGTNLGLVDPPGMPKIESSAQAKNASIYTMGKSTSGGFVGAEDEDCCEYGDYEGDTTSDAASIYSGSSKTPPTKESAPKTADSKDPSEPKDAEPSKEPKKPNFDNKVEESLADQLAKLRGIIDEESNDKSLKRNWIIKNIKTGKYWNSNTVGGWSDTPTYYSSKDLAYELPWYGKWINSDNEIKEAWDEAISDKAHDVYNSAANAADSAYNNVVDYGIPKIKQLVSMIKNRNSKIKVIKISIIPGMDNAFIGIANITINNKPFKIQSLSMEGLTKEEARKAWINTLRQFIITKYPNNIIAYNKDLSKFVKSVNESWDEEMHTSKKDKGMWDGWTIAELKKEKTRLDKKEKKSDKDSKRLKQVNFAIRAKQKNKFGKIKESSECTLGCCKSGTPLADISEKIKEHGYLEEFYQKKGNYDMYEFHKKLRKKYEEKYRLMRSKEVSESVTEHTLCDQCGNRISEYTCRRCKDKLCNKCSKDKDSEKHVAYCKDCYKAINESECDESICPKCHKDPCICDKEKCEKCGKEVCECGISESFIAGPWSAAKRHKK